MADHRLVSTLSRFRGCLVGALVGDCFGEPFEFDGRITFDCVRTFVDNVETGKIKKEKKILHYTDDTEMRLSVESSLLKNKGFDAVDMATRFANEYYSGKIDRNYGCHVPKVFSDWHTKRLQDVYYPASQQFNGTGSYGNGGGMRIAPAALFLYKENSEKLKELSDQITRLTHTHQLGILGAYLEARAVHLALHIEESPFPTDRFLQELIETMTHYEEEAFGKASTPAPPESPKLYSQKLEIIKKFLEETDVEKAKVVRLLGHDVSALGSIPISIYAFLRSLSTIRGLEERNAFERTIMYAIYLGGDTDTIATMAGAIAGAYWGEESIPKKWYQNCEGLSSSQKHATSLYEYVQKH